MKKRYIAALVCAVLLPPAAFAAGESGLFEATNFKLKIGNENIQLDEPLYVKNDRTYVPLRNICDALGIPVEWDDSNQEAVLDVYDKDIKVSEKTELKEEGVIPDEETALAVGKAILESYMGKPVEYETEDQTYYLTVDYLENFNAWSITQLCCLKNGAWGGYVYFPNVKISKSTGEVLYINTYSTLGD